MDLRFLVMPWDGEADFNVLYIFGVFMLYTATRCLVTMGTLLLWVNRAAGALKRRIYRLEYKPGQLLRELRYVASILLFDAVALIAMLKSGLAERDESHLLFTVLFSFAFVEVWFYAFHRACHHPRLFFIHRAHHDSRITTPLTALTVSFGERTVMLGGLGAALWAVSVIYPISYLGAAIYFMFNYLFNVLIHTNVEVFPPKWRWLLSWLSTPSHHALHHSRVKGHYGFTTRIMDRLFQTEFDDYEEVQKAAFNGHGLTAFNQRLAKSKSGRQLDRALVHCFVRIGQFSQDIISGVTLDLSVDGAAVYSKALLSPNAAFSIELLRPGDLTPIKLRARIKHRHAYQEGYRYGLKFEGIERRAEGRMRELVGAGALAAC